ncbi:hypothetical protein EYB53_001850 [Candidatus Chloroploca sp. M-50]|uniref:PPM-type phosphatase domain-containing protein n=1 Tax=Candidatus Chloroploca mongolica TaxID=2528176 RepID=A0ABS4D4S5_9CHLR|nr:hypothetical protein [Candidatus Chloroploca mongolica]MBP1464441.1 hypothetical protein [Candidatus Chloroploca mongolica]
MIKLFQTMMISFMIIISILIGSSATIAQGQPCGGSQDESCIDPKLLQFWRDNGGEALLGKPIGPSFDNNGILTQWFERARIDQQIGYAPQLADIGWEFVSRQPFAADINMQLSEIDIAPNLKPFWEANGGVDRFGLPITTAEISGNTEKQWFLRARIELVNNSGPQLINLGSELRKLVETDHLAPLSEPQVILIQPSIEISIPSDTRTTPIALTPTIAATDTTTPSIESSVQSEEVIPLSVDIKTLSITYLLGFFSALVIFLLIFLIRNQVTIWNKNKLLNKGHLIKKSFAQDKNANIDTPNTSLIHTHVTPKLSNADQSLSDLDLQIHGFTVPKHGNTDYENQDMWCYDDYKLVVADGSTDGFEARLWAEILSKGFIQKLPAETREGVLEWVQNLTQIWQDQTVYSGDLSWYIDAAQERGAGAALTGISFAKIGTTWNWKALAVGDTCLFLLRKNQLCCSFPITSSHEFNRTPDLLDTNIARNQELQPNAIKTTQDEVQNGDIFIFATDALAKTLLQAYEKKVMLWDQLLSIANQDVFQEYIDDLRQENQLDNDDTTLVVARITLSG